MCRVVLVSTPTHVGHQTHLQFEMSVLHRCQPLAKLLSPTTAYFFSYIILLPHKWGPSCHSEKSLFSCCMHVKHNLYKDMQLMNKIHEMKVSLTVSTIESAQPLNGRLFFPTIVSSSHDIWCSSLSRSFEYSLFTEKPASDVCN